MAGRQLKSFKQNTFGRKTQRRGSIRNRETAIDYVIIVAKYILLLVLVLYLISLGKKAYNLGYEIFCQQAVDQAGEGHEVTVEIPDGTSVKGIANILKSNGLIEDADIFFYQERLSSDHGKITPGTYTLSTEMTPDEIISILTENYEDTTSEETASEDTAAEETASEETASEDTTSEDTQQEAQ